MTHHGTETRAYAELRAGMLFDDKYRIVRPLGEGSFATVIHARHEVMDRDVALKFLRPEVMASHPEVAERFMNEVRLASRLKSPHTVAIFDFGKTSEGIPYMVLEYVDGRTLDEVIEKHGALGKRRSMEWCLQILESLQEAHAHHIIHRDLKPANIMVGRTARGALTVKVLDFGVAKLVERAEEKVKTSSGRQSTQFIGTPRYMSPEQILGQKVSAASDLYSVGLIFFEMCTGRPCIDESSVAKVARFHLSEEPLPLEGIEGLPEELRAIIHRATERHPSRRYASAGEIRQELDDILAGRARERGAQPTAPQTPRAMTEASDASEDVFSGKGYLPLPEDSEKELRSGAGTSSGSVRALGARGASAPSPQRSVARARPRNAGELDLDLGTVARQQRQLAREKDPSVAELRQHQERAATHAHWRLTLVGVLALGLLTFLSFALVSAAASPLGASARAVVGALPCVLSFIWVAFSHTLHFSDVTRRWLLPWVKRYAAASAIALVLVGLLIPGDAARGLRGDTLWFLGLSPEQIPMALRVTLGAIAGAIAAIYEMLEPMLPWAG
ncbi:hypothetical protein DL240_04335 [Lujinxingia litoralis]|uniref:Protein kinase domain-containing protein n=1 Tax=Lujinxingia litoralis TaxID=2211119 RepID=A0A328CAE8_9DELT|nr:serine/threonine-protein kinase [Lujinxingia litoralis]RAL25445.1 hypothetical protein DL240_04335 [Lujinxingia litoralis]